MGHYSDQYDAEYTRLEEERKRRRQAFKEPIEKALNEALQRANQMPIELHYDLTEVRRNIRLALLWLKES